MSNYSSLKATINANIKQNGNEEITGPILNSVLNAMVDSLAGYHYSGIATPATNPGTPDSNVFYIASDAGTYTNFGGLAVAEGVVAILKYNGSWTKEVTGAATAAEVSQLAQKVDLLVGETSIPSPNLFNKATVTAGDTAISKNSGNTFGYPGGVGSDFIAIPEGATSVYPNVHKEGGSAGWALYNSSKTFRTGGNTYPIPISEGDAYVRYTLPSDSASLDSAMLVVGTASDVPSEYMPYGTITSYNVKEDVIGEEQIKDESVTTDKIADGAVTAEKLAPGSVIIPDGAITTEKLAEESVTEQKTSFISVVEHKSTNLLNPDECVYGFIDKRNGDVVIPESFTSRYATGFIPVTSDEIYTNAANQYGSNGGWAVYNSNKEFIRGESYGIPWEYQPGDAFIRLTISTSGLGSSYYVVKATDPHEYTPFFEPYYTYELSEDIIIPDPESVPSYEPAISLAGKPGTKGTGDTISNETISLDDYPQYIKRCFNLSAVGKITTFGQLDLGVGKDTANGTFLRVDGTNIYFCRYYQGNVHYLFTQAHGLTITDFVDISAYMDDGEMTARVATFGGVFKHTFTKQIDMESYGIPFVTANENTALTGFSFRAAGVRFRLPIWIIGDSYCSWYSQRWPKQLSTSFDVTDFLLDGLAGGGSGTMFAELQKMLNYGTPKFLVWCLGMNDTFNDWNGIYTMLKELCKEKGITLVLQTIPWPENNASGSAQKALINAEIKASGLRYFDGYAAVSSDDNGTWYTGYCADEVHPTVEGAKAMAARFITDFPEILQ